MKSLDIYGSRYTLIPIMRSAEDIGYDIKKAYLGSSLSSQYAKTQKVDTKLVKKRLNSYEELEVLNDRLKLFRRFSSRTESRTIVVDFLNEGFEVINSVTGRLTFLPANVKFDVKINEIKYLSKDSRINLIDENLNTFIKDLNHYDRIVLNKLRLPKYKKTKTNNYILKENIENINVMNSFIESFEDLFLEKMEKVEVISLYKEHVYEGYWFSKEYLQHVKNYME